VTNRSLLQDLADEELSPSRGQLSPNYIVCLISCPQGNDRPKTAHFDKTMRAFTML